MEKKLISRNEIFANQITQINNEISQASYLDNYNDYVTQSIEKLKKIDNQYFSEILTLANKEFDESKFYLGKKRVEQNINTEVLSNINIQINFLNDLISNNNKDSIIDLKEMTPLDLNNYKYYFSNLKVISNEVYDQIENFAKEYQNQELVINNFSNVSKKLSSNEYVGFHKNIISEIKESPINEIIKKSKEENLKKINELERKKQIYQISIKWFFILIAIFLLIMSVSIITLVYS